MRLFLVSLSFDHREENVSVDRALSCSPPRSLDHLFARSLYILCPLIQWSGGIFPTMASQRTMHSPLNCEAVIPNKSNGSKPQWKTSFFLFILPDPPRFFLSLLYFHSRYISRGENGVRQSFRPWASGLKHLGYYDLKL